MIAHHRVAARRGPRTQHLCWITLRLDAVKLRCLIGRRWCRHVQLSSTCAAVPPTVLLWANISQEGYFQLLIISNHSNYLLQLPGTAVAPSLALPLEEQIQPSHNDLTKTIPSRAIRNERKRQLEVALPCPCSCRVAGHCNWLCSTRVRTS